MRCCMVSWGVVNKWKKEMGWGWETFEPGTRPYKESGCRYP